MPFVCLSWIWPFPTLGIFLPASILCFISIFLPAPCPHWNNLVFTHTKTTLSCQANDTALPCQVNTLPWRCHCLPRCPIGVMCLSLALSSVPCQHPTILSTCCPPTLSHHSGTTTTLFHHAHAKSDAQKSLPWPYWCHLDRGSKKPTHQLDLIPSSRFFWGSLRFVH